VFNGNLVLGAYIIFIHRYGVKETLKWLFCEKKGKKNKVLTCVLIVNHFSLNEDELELGTEVGGGFFSQCWVGI